MGPLKKSLGQLFDDLELVEADLTNDASIKKAIEGATYVIHTASPIPTKTPKDKNELIRPAVDGTISVLEGAKQHGVKRVVITSTIGTVYDKKLGKDLYNEEDFAAVDKNTGAYVESKIEAE